MIRYSDEMKPDDMRHMFSKNRLIRTETSTLIGLLIKNDIDCALPAPQVLQQYIEKTEALLEEIHQSMSAAFLASLDPKRVAGLLSIMLGCASNGTPGRRLHMYASTVSHSRKPPLLFVTI